MDDYKKRKSEPMSGDEVLAYLPNAKLIVYSDLINYDNIDNVFGDCDIILFLYQMTSLYNGHWTILLRNRNMKHIHFFDSYGMKIDKELNYVSKNIKKMIGADNKYLSKLLRKGNYTVTFNNCKYQKDGVNIQTCGRHCILRALNMNIDEDFYHDFYFKNKNLSPDDIVSFLIK